MSPSPCRATACGRGSRRRAARAAPPGPPRRAGVGALLRPGEAGHGSVQWAGADTHPPLRLPGPAGLAALESLAAFAEAQDRGRPLGRGSGGEPTLVAQRRPVRVVV